MKTGIIYCPKHAGLKSSRQRWERISEALKEHGIEYDLVQSESQQSVGRLFSMLAHNGYDTIIIVGGDRALNDAVNSLMKEEKAVRDSIALGIIPNGTNNDFASFWGFKENNIEKSIKSLVEHRTRLIDVACLHYIDKDGKSHHHHFVDCVNIGLVAAIQRLRKRTRKIFWSRKISFIISLILLLFQRMTYHLQYTIDYETEEHNLMNMCVGNTTGYGLAPNAVPYNGLLDISVAKESFMKQLFSGIALFLRGKLLNHSSILPYRCQSIEVQMPLMKETPVCIDGKMLSISNRHTTINIDVEQEAINFIIEPSK